MCEWVLFDRDEVRLALADLGGEGRPFLLLHGLAGHAEEWSDTAKWLSESHHVFALDLRGHGRSERLPNDVSPRALADDVVAALERIGQPAVLGGQSLGGSVSILVAASHPQLVRDLVVVEADPEGLQEQEASALIADVEARLRAWPVPFENEQEALDYFGAPSPAATAWVRGLEKREDGLWPRFEVEVLVKMIEQMVGASSWEAWATITCPTLIVRGARGSLSEAEARRMAEAAPSAHIATIDAGHDVHLDNPEAWSDALTRFLAEVE